MEPEISIPRTLVSSISIPREPLTSIPCNKVRWRRPAYNSLYCEDLDQWISDKLCLFCTERKWP